MKVSDVGEEINPDNSLVKNCLIPAQTGIQMINNSPRKWDNTMVLSASQSIFYDWIPACAGMTV
jgi:hypothetical protein